MVFFIKIDQGSYGIRIKTSRSIIWSGWSTIYTPKEFGGLDFTNTKFMSECLTTKCVYKIFKREVVSGLMSSKTNICSP